MEKQKILVILGTTSSGKTDLSVNLAKKFNGEIVSVDSRQVYKGLDIGSGKVTKKEMKGVKHHLLDIASPNRSITGDRFRKLAEKTIKDILKRRELPILVGGTGLYIQSIVDNIVFPDVKPNLKLRNELEKKSIEEMVKILKKLDPERLKEIDQKNPRRLIRAIEIAKELGKVPKLPEVRPRGKYEFLQIGIKVEDDILKDRIEKRFKKRVKGGIVAEAKKLHQKGLSWKRMNEIGLAHKYIAKYLKGEISKEEMIESSVKEEWKYAKRQRTWFKRDKRIKWFKLEEKEKIEKEVKNFLK